MANMADIKLLSTAIVHEFHPKRIVLFGSYAWGGATQDSDVDLLVILPFEGKSWRMASAIRERLRPSFPLDLLVRTEQQVSERLKRNDSFLSEILNKGKVLHEG
jgi:predicted nucleotidyltransferase